MSAFAGHLKHVRTASLISAAFMLASSGVVYVDWARDNSVLREQALRVTRGARNPSSAIVALNHWVYGHEGFAKNHRYFLWKALGPTPVQVLESGGDCSDKSRLVSAMLFQVGISSGLVMVYPCTNCAPIHTVVEAEYEKGRMIVDPIWNVDYPAEDGRYYGVRELAGTSFGRERIQLLKANSSPSSKIAVMPPSEATFDYAQALNWNKNAVLRTTAAALRLMKIEPALILRPRIMEDPKLAVWVFLLWAAIAFFVIGGLAGLASSRYSARSADLKVAAGGDL